MAEQFVAHQPATSTSISFQHLFNRAGGRTSDVLQNYRPPHLLEYLRDNFPISLSALFQRRLLGFRFTADFDQEFTFFRISLKPQI